MTTTDAPDEQLVVTTDDGILRIHLNRPTRRNALPASSVALFVDALERAGTDDGIRAVLITASGDHFCSGMDLTRDRSEGEVPRRPTSMHRSIDAGPHRIVELIASIEVPVVTAVRGHAAGLGCSIALASDFAVTSETAVFSAPFIKRGFTPDSGSTFLLPRALGGARAREFLMLGRPLSAADAERWGVVSRLVPDEELDAAAAALAAELAAGPTTSIGLVKWLLARNVDATFSEALRNESLIEDIATRTADFREGVGAFMQKRDPRFAGN